MAKSVIIKQLANNEISIEVALSRLLIIASCFDDENLMQWAKCELNGYGKEDSVPNYRVVGKGHFTYSGINGNFQVTNGPLPPIELGGEIEGIMARNCFRESIAAIDEYSKSKSPIARDISFMAGFIYETLGIQCFSVNETYAPQTFTKIISAIRTMLLEIFIKLDKEFGTLDNLDINIEGKDLSEIKREIALIIFQDNSISIGEKNRIRGSLFGSKKRG